MFATIRSGLETSFEKLGDLIYSGRWLVLLLCVIACIGFGSQLSQITIDNSHDSYLHADAPESITYDRFRRQFGQDELILVAVEPSQIFDLDFLEKLRDFHQELEQKVPYIAEVTSLINARQMRGENDLLIVEDLLEDWPENEADLAELRQRVLANPLYLDQYISRDERFTTLVIRSDIEQGEEGLDDLQLLDGFDDGEEVSSTSASTFFSTEKKAEMVDVVDEIVSRYESESFKVNLAGGFVFSSRITQLISKDVSYFIAVCAAVIFLFLLLLFKRVTGVLLPFLIVIVTIVSTFGLMAMVGIPFSVTMQMLPVFLLCVCVCNSVHLLVPIYQSLNQGKDKRTAVREAMRHSALAILMTSLTTAAGMGSFMAADLLPIGYLGVVSAFGVLLSFVITIFLLPALVAILPIVMKKSPTKAQTETRNGYAGRVLVVVGQFALKNPWAVMVATALLLIWAGIGIAQLRFAHQPISWFPEEHEIRLSTDLIDESLGGSRSIEIVVDTKKENGLHDPSVLAQVEDAIGFAKNLQEGELHVGKIVSFVDILKETNQALNGNNPEYYRIPKEKELIAQELLLFENSGSDDLEPLVDSQFSMARISLRTPRADRVLYQPFLDRLEEGLLQRFNKDISVEVTGIAPLLGQIFLAMVSSMAKSYLIAFMVIIPLMILLVGSFRMGMMSMLPNFFPIVMVLGVMGWFDIPLDTSSILIGSILIGLAVDDTIHIMHHFRRYFDQLKDVASAVTTTLQTTGVALLFTTLVLGTGFLSIGFNATMSNTIRFGYITALGIAVAFIADIVISPALMAIIYQKKQKLSKKTN